MVKFLGYFDSGSDAMKDKYSNDSSAPDFPSKKIWTRLWPLMVAFFLWQCVLNRLPTLDNLHQRNSSLVTPSGNIIANVCCLCKLTAESNTHLFLECSLTKQIWGYFSLEADKSINFSGSTMDLINNWSTSRLSVRSKEVWKRLPGAILWVIWNERNARTFYKKERKVEELIIDIKMKVFQWARYSPYMSGIAISDLIVKRGELFFKPP
ncbi:uncharacterized protein LOC113294201 [Papaver somniferum]|uniref:uncharacterized protein LOC113294201 n=1 Tax=Papaver somniferum TaxID=3469 RepID=UPI000E6FAB38|nr:uncharacterized protein LOC113294201 [Papaver somniferum]